jgi:UDP-N-acetylglucosamine:LPS N-acetylglucosamine transferase
MTQAMAVKETVERAGHEVVRLVLGTSLHRLVPPFFASAMKMPITQIPTLDFSFKNNRKVSLWGTVAGIVRKLPAYWRALRQLKAIVRESRPDVIINFFEPLTGVYALTCRNRPPVVAVGHQFMYGHPDYVRAPGLRLQQLAMKWYVRLVGAASSQ